MLSDVVMPGMSGRELAEHLRDRSPETKVLLMSGYTEDAVIRRGIAGSEVDFLQKPIQPRVLTEKVAAALSGSTAKRRSE